ncbi:MAG: hypothetical protein IJV40_13150 [Oscillospiraceae bacterium]|nr:hypothetical protein [Oscillospiraceae bacterium]
MNLYGNKLFFALLLLMLFVLQAILLRLHPQKAEGINRRVPNQVITAVFCFCTALFAASLFHLYPGNTRPPMQDSSVFLYIGKRMAEGKLPYRDLFDHKGPLLYLLQLLGIRLTPDSLTGVWLLELLNLFLTAFILLKLASLITDCDTNARLSVFAVLGICGWMVWQGGNFTEEYALPWISSAAYISFRFFRNKSYKRRDIVLLGGGFAVVLLLRANMIAAWITLIPVVLILLLKEKRFSEIGQCVALFFTGIMIVVIPVVIWAAKAGFLRELWQDYILFNFRYTESVGGGIKERILLTGRFMVVLFPAAIAMIVSLLIAPRNRLLWYNLAFFVISAITAAMSGRLYYHYAIVMLPATVLPFCVCFSTTGKWLQREEQKRYSDPVISILVFCLTAFAATGYRHVSSKPGESDPVMTFLNENTQAEDDVLFLGNSSWYYLLADRKTDNRFFYQLPPLEVNRKLGEQFEQELKAQPSDYILITGDFAARNRVKERLREVWPVLEQEILADYEHTTYDLFEVYIRRQED